MEEYPIVPSVPNDGDYCSIYTCNTINYETGEQAPLSQPGFPANQFVLHIEDCFDFGPIDSRVKNYKQQKMLILRGSQFMVNGSSHHGPLLFANNRAVLHFQIPGLDILNNMDGTLSADEWMRTRVFNIIKDGPFELIKVDLLKGTNIYDSDRLAIEHGCELLASDFVDVNSGNVELHAPEFVLYENEMLYVVIYLLYRCEAVYLMQCCNASSEYYVNSENYNVDLFFNSSVQAIVQVQMEETDKDGLEFDQ